MRIFEWTAAYETGIEAIDTQHKYLVTLINQLDGLLHHGASDEDDVLAGKLGDIYTELFDYTVYHFNFEEKLMEASATYPQAAQQAHKKQHDQFIHELRSVLDEFGGMKKEDGEVILSFLKHWLINHICKIDKKLASHIDASCLSGNEGSTSETRPLGEVTTSPQGEIVTHLIHHLDTVEAQMANLTNQLPLPTTSPDEKTCTARQTAERITRRLQILKTLAKQLQSSTTDKPAQLTSQGRSTP